jgi:hypothetical protein
VTAVDLVRATLEQAWQAECASDIYLARQVVDLRGLLAEARAREAELRTAGKGLSISLDATRRRLAELDGAPGGAALDSAVDALLNQADLTGDADLPAVAEWLRRLSALDDD